jgi:hypothetical protein
MAMCSFQQYFTYQLDLICGIPQVTLLGTVDDWRLLRQKIERLVEFDGADKLMSEQWVPVLREVLDNFVESANNGSENNLDFWNQIVSNTGASCGGPELLTGWISAFSVFNDKGELYADMDDGDWPVIRLDDIYHNVASCPATIDDNGRKYNATLFVGQMAYDFVVDEAATENIPEAVAAIDTGDGYMRILKPRNDWALAISEGYTPVPAKDPEEDAFEPPDGTLIYGEECYLNPYNHSGGIYYDPLEPPATGNNDTEFTPLSGDSSSSENDSSSDSSSEKPPSGDDLTINTSHSNQNGLSSIQTRWVTSVLGALILFWILFLNIRKKRGLAAAEDRDGSATHTAGSSKLRYNDESGRTTVEESGRKTVHQPNKDIAAADDISSSEDEWSC